jgi:hypothetical protein
MRDKKEVKEEIIELLERPILAYIQKLLEKVGEPITEDEAENLLGNIGMRRFLKNQSKGSSFDL